MGAAVELGPLEERDFPLLWLGQATSAFGSALVPVARDRHLRNHPAARRVDAVDLDFVGQYGRGDRRGNDRTARAIVTADAPSTASPTTTKPSLSSIRRAAVRNDS